MSGTRALRPRTLLTTVSTTSPLGTLARLAAPLTALVLLAAPAAQAATWTHTDASGDTQVTDRGRGGDVRGPMRDSKERHGDLTKVTAQHRADVLRVAVSVREDAAIPILKITVVTSRGGKFTAVYEPYESSREDTAMLLTPHGREVECDDLTIHPTSAGYLATIPRHCIANAYRVRIGVQTDFYYGGNPVMREVEDDVLRTGRVDRDAPRLSPWIVRDAVAGA
ncbi:hypothetical protein [Nocardioides plantarum]|uniref:Uncharacterized protein n=1 Tax=Nocardioides plantarum TaxID=29299 RepID=A0ABV5KB33_9ACTN|nr:hypothetical protein [Nocardioides plantarum]